MEEIMFDNGGDNFIFEFLTFIFSVVILVLVFNSLSGAV